jgi:hypothetical protein
MKNKTTYTVKGQKSATDIVANRVEILETGYDLDSAKAAAISYQKNFGYVCAWIEEETKVSPRVVRRIERDARGNKHTAVYCDQNGVSWAI